MAIIYSYPKVTSPLATDVLVLTDTTLTAGKRKNKTKSIAMSDVANYVISSTSGITGGGTLNTIPLWTPNGFKLGDSIITQAAFGQGVTITGQLDVTGDFNVTGSTELFSTLEVQGASTFSNVSFQGVVFDGGGNPGTAGQVLSSTGSGGDTEWVDPSSSITKLIPTIFVGTPSGSDTFSTNNNIVELQWVGGTGTYVLNIPSATDIPYRKIRFAIDGSFPGGGGHRIDITAQPGETIDGNSSFRLNRTYEGAAIWSTGTEWIVIQLKG